MKQQIVMEKMDILVNMSLLPQAKVSYHSNPFSYMDIDLKNQTTIEIPNKLSPSVVTSNQKIFM